MKIPRRYRPNKIRLIFFLFAAMVHIALLVYVVIPVGSKIAEEDQSPPVIRLMDIEEERPAPPLPPPPEKSPEIETNTVEAVAETMIETEEIPEGEIVTEPVYPEEKTEEIIEYLPMGKVTNLPEMPENELRQAIVYPAIPRRAGIEGIAYLELFIDSQGNIRNVTLLRENPEGRGFGEAAMNAILSIQAKGLKATPGRADGRDVGVRFRYPIRFELR